MKQLNPPFNNCNRKVGFINLASAIRPVLCALIILLGIKGIRANDLYAPPAISQVIIIVANLQTGLLDKTLVGFNPLSVDSFSPVYDANKLFGSPNRQTLYTMNSGQYMSINTLPYEATTDSVLMGMAPGVNGTFQFSFSGLESFDSSIYIFLEDKKTNVWHDLRKGTYTFTSLTTDDWNRFLIHFTPPVVITGTNANCAPTSTINIQQPGMASWTYVLTDSMNAIIDSGTLSQNQSASVQVPAGAYHLALTDSSSYTAVKNFHVDALPAITAVDFQVPDSAVRVMELITLTNPFAASDTTNTGTQTFQWDFGNGIIANGVDTSISYTKPGNYAIGLTVTNQLGCNATTTHSISVTETQATGLADINTNTDLNIWSGTNKVYVDFTSLHVVDATIAIYNVLGQEISNEHYTGGSLYQKEMDNLSASYLIVKVFNNHQTTAKKLFVGGTK